jgi:hypothetical protein
MIKLGDTGSLACTIFSALVRSSWRICDMSGNNSAKSANSAHKKKPKKTIQASLPNKL